MTKAIITTFHKYQPYGGEYYEPILDFFLQTMKKYMDEYNQLYLVDSNWGVPESIDYKVLKVNPHLRYFDAYKSVIPQVKEDFILFIDNDMVVYKPNQIARTFRLLMPYLNMDVEPGKEEVEHDVVSIYDTIGIFTSPKLNGKSKFCLYWFAAPKELLMKYLDVEWSPSMPDYETLGLLTQKMLSDDAKPYEWEEDKNSIYLDGTQDGDKSNDLGYYHIRSGSVPAVLLAYKDNDPKQYWEYLKNQPRREYLRQIAWYQYMLTETNTYKSNIGEKLDKMLTEDLQIPRGQWEYYMKLFIKYHGLE